MISTGVPYHSPITNLIANLMSLLAVILFWVDLLLILLTFWFGFIFLLLKLTNKDPLKVERFKRYTFKFLKWGIIIFVIWFVWVTILYYWGHSSVNLTDCFPSPEYPC